MSCELTDSEVAYIDQTIADLQAENEKLRELVRDFYPFASVNAANPWLSVRLERMRELGVEVDE